LRRLGADWGVLTEFVVTTVVFDADVGRVEMRSGLEIDDPARVTPMIRSSVNLLRFISGPSLRSGFQQPVEEKGVTSRARRRMDLASSTSTGFVKPKVGMLSRSV